MAAAAAGATSNSLFDVAFRSSSSSSFAPGGQSQAVFIRALPRRKSPRLRIVTVVDNLGQQEHSSSSSASTTTTTTKLAPASASAAAATKIQRGIPGSYGPPLLGSVRDRLEFFRGVEEFLRSRAEQHGSTVFRINVPPGPPFFPDSRVIVLLDQKSFPVLFDTSKVSKKNVFTGTYMPSTSFTGGYRVLSYLDPEEPKHAQLKAFCFDLLKSNGPRWIPEFHAACSSAFNKWEQQQIQKNQKKQQGAELNHTIDQFVLSFLTKCVLDQDAASPAPDGLSGKGPALIREWLAPQIVPVVNAGKPLPVEMLLHMFPLPFFLVSGTYKKIVDFFSKHGGRALDIAARHGIQRDEALHNLVFFVCFNTFGGLIRLLPSVLQHVHGAGLGLQQELKDEIRAAVEAQGGALSMKAMESMPLLQSTIYEVLRINPPVAFQYGRAKRDLVIETHQEAFRVKEGEMLFGYQPFATRDPEVFHRPDEFLPRRFMGDEGKRLLKHLIWSNGPENEAPQVSNKQCAGKDFVLLVARLFVAELFLRFDSFELGEPEKNGPETIFRFTSLLKREMSVAATVGQ